MRTHLEFRSQALRGTGESWPPGEAVARLLEAALPPLGFPVDKVVAEDWGWCLVIANKDFSLWIGCGDYLEYPDGHLCFIEPSRQVIRRWFRSIDVRGRTEPLADAIETAVAASGMAHDLRWWSEEEAARG